MEDVIILGAGIAGLYLGIELLKRGTSVLILEKSNRVGGRIKSIKYLDTTMESGAGRFSECHKNLFQLLKKYNLLDKKYPIEKYSQVKLIHTQSNLSNNIEDYYKIIFDKSKEYSDEYLSKKYTYEILLEIFGSQEVVDHFSILYGYDGDIRLSNAICGLNMLACDYNSKQFNILLGGLEQLIHKMKEEFLQLGGVLHLNTLVKDIYQSKNHFLLQCKNKEYTCNKLVLAITPMAIQKLKPLNHYFDFLNYVQAVPLLRIYFYYNKPNSQLAKLKKIITDLDIRFIIPMNQNSIMISYSDSILADKWYKLYYENPDGFYEKLLGEFEVVTGIKLEKPDKTFLEYWQEGIYVWTPNYNYIRNYDKVIQPLKNLYICNEGVSKKQGWIEGSLLIAKDVLEKIL